MADTLQITDGTYTLSLRQAAVYLLLDTWRTAPMGDGTVMETFQVAFTGTDATIRSNVELLMRFRKRAADFFRFGTLNFRVWLQIYGDGETAKQALIYEMSAVPTEEGTLTALLGRGAIVYQVAILRSESWEAQANVLISGINVNANGGIVADDNSLVEFGGSANGRIGSINLGGGPATPLYRVWMGIQPYNTYTGYTPISAYFDASWEAEAGTAVLGSFVNDATASPAGTSSNCLEVTSVPATLGRAWWSRLYDHNAGNEAYYAGEWFVLGRIKVDAGTVAVQLRWGTGANSTDAYMVETANDITYVSNTGWRLIELGKVKFPANGRWEGISTMPISCLSVFIQQTSGTTTSFKLDEIILIPARHFLKASKVYLSPTVDLDFNIDPDGKCLGLIGGLNLVPEMTIIDWEYPYQRGFLVFAGEAENAHTLTDNVDIELTIYRHYSGHYA